MTLEEMYRFAAMVASERDVPVMVRDDSIQEGVLAGLRVDQASDPYVRTAIRNTITSIAFRGRPMTGEHRSNNGHNRPTTAPLEDLTREPGFETDMETAVYADQLWSAVEAAVSTRDFQLLARVFRDERTLKEVSLEMGHAASWAHRHLNTHVYPRLREALKEDIA